MFFSVPLLPTPQELHDAQDNAPQPAQKTRQDESISIKIINVIKTVILIMFRFIDKPPLWLQYIIKVAKNQAT